MLHIRTIFSLTIGLPLLVAGCGQVSVDAGLDQVVIEDQKVSLTALGGSAGQSGTPEFLWEQLDGPVVALENPASSSTSFMAPIVDEDTTLTFQVTALVPISSLRISAIDTVTVTVQANVTPASFAGNDQTVEEGEAVSIEGDASIDSDEFQLSTVWAQISGPQAALSGENSETLEFTAPPVTEISELVFELTVTAEEGNSITDTVTITVNPAAPNANAGEDQVATEADTVTLDASNSTDPDDGDPSFSWTQTAGPTASLSSNVVAMPFFVAPTVSETSTLEFEVSVTSEDGTTSATDSVFVTVAPMPDPTAVITGDTEAFTVATIQLSAEDSGDPAGGVLTYAWEQLSGPSITEIDLEGLDISFSVDAVDVQEEVIMQLTVTAEDGTTGTATALVQILPFPTDFADAGGNIKVNEGTSTALDGSGSFDPAGGSLTYKWTTNSSTLGLISSDSPTPVIVAPSISGSVNSNPGSSFEVTLTVTSSSGVESTDTIVVSVVNTG